jgi:ankyrin repeat protein
MTDSIINRIKQVKPHFISGLLFLLSLLFLLPVLFTFYIAITNKMGFDAITWFIISLICSGLLMLLTFISMILTLVSWLRKRDRKIAEYLFLVNLLVFLTPLGLAYGHFQYQEYKRVASAKKYYNNLNLDQKLAYQLDSWHNQYSGLPFGNDSDIQHLIRQGANINAPNEQGLSPLCRAVIQGYRTGLVQYILDNGAIRNQFCAEGLSVVHTAAKNCNAPNLEVLAKNHFELTGLTGNHETPFDLILASAERNPYSCIQTALTLKKYGVDISQTDSEGNTILHLVAARTSKIFVQQLIEAGVNPGIKNSQGQTAGMAAKAYYQEHKYSLDHPVIRYLEEQENVQQQ